MRLLDPETFVDQPYVAGLNQGGHVAAGAALVALATLLPLPLSPYTIAALVFGSLELWQFTRRSGQLWDGVADLVFWCIGATVWSEAIGEGHVAGWVIFYPVWLCVLMGAVMLVYSLFKPTSKED